VATINAVLLERKILSEEISPAYLVYGQEQYWHDKLVAALASKFNDGANYLPGDEIGWSSLCDMLSQQSFFGPTLWVIREAQCLFSNGALPHVPRIAEGNCLFLSCPVKKNPADRSFASTWVRAGYVIGEAGELSFSDTIQWISQAFVERGLSVSRDACEELIAISGRSLERLMGEIEKISLYVRSGDDTGKTDIITPSLITECASKDPESNTFAFIDAVATRNARKASSELLELESRGYHPVFLIAVLANHFGLMWRAKELQSKRLSQQELAKSLGVSPYPAKKAAAQARLWNYRELEGVLRLLLHIDENIKKGRVDPTSAMEHLILGICTKETSIQDSYSIAASLDL
jgi:DNA polymerase III delta subunit